MICRRLRIVNRIIDLEMEILKATWSGSFWPSDLVRAYEQGRRIQRRLVIHEE